MSFTMSLFGDKVEKEVKRSDSVTNIGRDSYRGSSGYRGLGSREGFPRQSW